jgi:predicted membrane GTPase involved in stress response
MVLGLPLATVLPVALVVAGLAMLVLGAYKALSHRSQPSALPIVKIDDPTLLTNSTPTIEIINENEDGKKSSSTKRPLGAEIQKHVTFWNNRFNQAHRVDLV